MPKIICHMHSGHPFTIKSGVLVPGKPAEVECSEYQAQCLREDCRVVLLDKMPATSAKPKKAKPAKPTEDETKPNRTK
jgi:hypothetical protein